MVSEIRERVRRTSDRVRRLTDELEDARKARDAAIGEADLLDVPPATIVADSGLVPSHVDKIVLAATIARQEEAARRG